MPEVEVIRLTIFEYDACWDDDFLGKMTIQVNDVLHEGTLDKWYQLEGVEHGEIRLQMTWLPVLENPIIDFERCLVSLYFDNCLLSKVEPEEYPFRMRVHVSVDEKENNQVQYQEAQTRLFKVKKPQAFIREGVTIPLHKAEGIVFKVELKSKDGGDTLTASCKFYVDHILSEPDFNKAAKTFALDHDKGSLVIAANLKPIAT